MRLLCVLTLFTQITSAFWVSPQPKTNIWVTLANLTNQEAICLSLSTPGNPFSTCLVGVPADTWPCPSKIPTCKANESRTTVNAWDQWAPYLPLAPLEPQEVELLGSVKADACVYFNFTSKAITPGNNYTTVVNSSLSVYQNASLWCNYTAKNISLSSTTPIQLPAGMFLICGDRAWAGIPSRLRGGPCTLGRLPLLTPNTSMILNYTRHHRHRREKRLTHQFTKECNSNVDFWSAEQRIFASILTPGVASAQSLATLNKLGCWLAKQTNATSLALSNLLADVDSVRHATLQNRAAIDFLLLAQGHGCEEFEGMCCMNLSDHSQSIHAQIDNLRELTGQLRLEQGWGLDGWLASLGLGPWITSILKIAVMIGIVILLTITCLPCICMCLQNAIQRTMQTMCNQHLLAQSKENGGNVERLSEAWVQSKGHDQMKFLKA